MKVLRKKAQFTPKTIYLNKQWLIVIYMTDKKKTHDLIRVRVETKKELDKLKLIPNETYDHIIGRLLEGIKE